MVFRKNEWVCSNLKANWVGVHFRGTDLVVRKQGGGFIEMDTYIYYLERVINKHCNIFVCTDQAQFIDLMHETFPGRVFSRDIQRAYDNRRLHDSPDYASAQQRIDALIDLLILSKAGLVYKTAGAFSYLTRFFNPSVKIISTIRSDSKYHKCHPENFIHPPKAHLLTNQSFLRYNFRRGRLFKEVFNSVLMFSKDKQDCQLFCVTSNSIISN